MQNLKLKKETFLWVKEFHLVRDMFVADTMEEAKEKAGEHMVNYMRWVCHWRGLGNHMDPGEELPELLKES